MSGTTYQIRGRVLIIEDAERKRREVEFSWPIKKVVQDRDILVVLLDPRSEKYNENVFAINANGETIWQIPPREQVYEDSPYTNIAIDRKGIVAVNWGGPTLVLDLMTGTVLDEIEEK